MDAKEIAEIWSTIDCGCGECQLCYRAILARAYLESTAYVMQAVAEASKRARQRDAFAARVAELEADLARLRRVLTDSITCALLGHIAAGPCGCDIDTGSIPCLAHAAQRAIEQMKAALAGEATTKETDNG